MKITHLELFHITIPFSKPYKLSKLYGTVYNADAVILKMHTSDGLVGWGEADPMNPFTDETPETVMAVIRDLIAPLLTGKDPTQIAMIESDLDKRVHGHLTARGAVNMALFDIVGKKYQVPAYTFIGGIRHHQLPLLGPIGSGTPDQDAKAIDELLEQGYGTVMIKMGALPIDQEIERLKSAVKLFGDKIKIVLDANQGWQYKDALKLARVTQEFTPVLLEQPISRNNLEGLAIICEQSACPVSVDESLVTLQDAANIIRQKSADVFSIKVSKNGGLSKSLKVANVAGGFGLTCLMNSMLEFGITQAASLQLGCTLDNLVDCGHAYMSVLRMSDDITDFDQNILKAVVTVPDKPGLGVEIDEKKLKKYLVSYLKLEA
ncbi:MAG: mandelate racemase [Desulfobacteraceae bacterium]|nr:mandelate racemase [Desulfobacteraceae bacterium]